MECGTQTTGAFHTQPGYPGLCSLCPHLWMKTLGSTNPETPVVLRGWGWEVR